MGNFQPRTEVTDRPVQFLYSSLFSIKNEKSPITFPSWIVSYCQKYPKSNGVQAEGESRACALAHISTNFKEIFKYKEHEPESLTEESSPSISFPPSPFSLDKHTISSRCERAMRQTKEIKDRTTLKRSREATTQAQHTSSKQAEALYHYLVHRWTTQKIWEQLGMRKNKCMERRGEGKWEGRPEGIPYIISMQAFRE